MPSQQQWRVLTLAFHRARAVLIPGLTALAPSNVNAEGPHGGWDLMEVKDHVWEQLSGLHVKVGVLKVDQWYLAPKFSPVTYCSSWNSTLVDSFTWVFKVLQWLGAPVETQVLLEGIIHANVRGHARGMGKGMCKCQPPLQRHNSLSNASSYNPGTTAIAIWLYIHLHNLKSHLGLIRELHFRIC